MRGSGEAAGSIRALVAIDLTQVAQLDVEPGELPATMAAWVIREERFGEPLDAFQLEEIEVPEPGAFEVTVRVMAAGVNFNNVWAALGEPVSVFRYHPEDHHIGGSDASGIVWKVGEGVTRWQPGDEVVIHCNQASYEDLEVHGLDPLAAPSQQIWGYETTWGSFAQFCKVQAQQLLPKPAHLSWEEAASYGLTYFTAYRMLIDQAKLQAGHKVLVWGAAGGLGVFALQLCKLTGADAVGVVSSEEKGELCRTLGACGFIDRNEFAGMMRRGGETPRRRRRASRSHGASARPWPSTWAARPTSSSSTSAGPRSRPRCSPSSRSGRLSSAERLRAITWTSTCDTCGRGRSRSSARTSRTPGSAIRANQLVDQGRIRPVLWKALGFDGVAEAHQLMRDNRHQGKIAILVGAASEGEGASGEGPGAIRAHVGA